MDSSKGERVRSSHKGVPMDRHDLFSQLARRQACGVQARPVTKFQPLDKRDVTHQH